MNPNEKIDVPRNEDGTLFTPPGFARRSEKETTLRVQEHLEDEVVTLSSQVQAPEWATLKSYLLRENAREWSMAEVVREAYERIERLESRLDMLRDVTLSALGPEKFAAAFAATLGAGEDKSTDNEKEN